MWPCCERGIRCPAAEGTRADLNDGGAGPPRGGKWACPDDVGVRADLICGSAHPAPGGKCACRDDEGSRADPVREELSSDTDLSL